VGTEENARWFKDLSFYVVATPGSSWVEYVGYSAVEGEDGPSFEKAESPSFDRTAKLSEAAEFFSGEVKWDGCSNWTFKEQDRNMIHGCDRTDLVNLGLVLAACWDWTRELLPTWIED